MRLFAMVWVALMCVAAGMFAACDGEARGETLQVISPHWEGIRDEFGAAFERHYLEETGRSIKVVWRDMGGTADDLRFIKSAFADRPEGIDVDIFFGGGVYPYRQLKDLGLLEMYEAPEEILSGIPQDLKGVPLYDAEHYWYGTAISGFGIIYNREILEEIGAQEPATWEDLAAPGLFGWVGAGDPRHSGVVHMMYEIILQAYGWQRGWQVITAMVANTQNIATSSNDIPLAIANGQAAVGTAIDFYGWNQMELAGRERIGFVMPAGLTVINPDSIGILKGAPNLPAAKAFVDFVLSEAGQKIWYLRPGCEGGPEMTNLFRMPVRADLYERFSADSSVAMNPFEEDAGFDIDSQLSVTRYSAIGDLVGAVLVDCHEELVAAWKKAVEAGRTEDVLAELAVPPVTEDELTRLAQEELGDPISRNSIVAQWVKSARAKCERLGK